MDNIGVKYNKNLQLVSGEAGPGSLGGFGLVDLLLSGNRPFHINTGPCASNNAFNVFSGNVCIINVIIIKAVCSNNFFLHLF